MAEEKKDLDTRYHEARRDSVAAMVSEQQDASTALVSSLGFDPQSVHASIHMGANGPTLWVYGATQDDGQSAATFISVEQIKQHGVDALYEQMKKEGFGNAVTAARDNTLDVPGKQQLDDLQALVNNEVKQHQTYAHMEDLKGQVAARDAKKAAEEKLAAVKDELTHSQEEQQAKASGVVKALLADAKLQTADGIDIETNATMAASGDLTVSFTGCGDFAKVTVPAASLNEKDIHAALSDPKNWSFDNTVSAEEKDAFQKHVVTQITSRGADLGGQKEYVQNNLAEKQVASIGALADASQKETELTQQHELASASVSAAQEIATKPTHSSGAAIAGGQCEYVGKATKLDEHGKKVGEEFAVYKDKDGHLLLDKSAAQKGGVRSEQASAADSTVAVTLVVGNQTVTNTFTVQKFGELDMKPNQTPVDISKIASLGSGAGMGGRT